MKRRNKPPQIEIKFDKPEPFALAVQKTTDGDRVTTEVEQLEADKQEAERRQETFV